MSPDPQIERRAHDEAAQWFARLNAPAISTAELNDFRTWRRIPANDAAYTGLEHLWRGADALRTDPEVNAALREAQVRNRTARRSLAPLVWISGLGALATGVLGVILFSPVWPGGQTYQTGVGETRSVALADGSQIRLDTNSRVRVRYGDHDRAVVLEQGQALFDVVHRADRPFQVSVGDTRIEDLGTRFDVRRDGGQVRITVVQGSVNVVPSRQAAVATLVAGQQMTAGTGAAAPHAVDAEKATSWTTGRLLFEDMPLAAATEEMNRYGRRKVILQAADVGAIKVNGAFDSTDTAAFVAAVSNLYNLKAEPQANGDVILSAPRLDRPG